MKFSLVVHASPFSEQASSTAYRYAKCLLSQGHEIYRVFYYGDGVMVANSQIAPPQDEANLPKLWTELANEHSLDLVVCIAAAVKRGVLDQNEAKRYEKDAANLADGFELSGLGQLAEAIAISDRVVTFGG
ncbi:MULTISPECIES: sulfurtransferase complex subunit TusD [unclassified Neptuniibacter]|uniref:sulfurtransferase complex subunit TusD n=1 Tax=unclassified Neptuniibacter TaxID=2630693 RepID=UPI000C4461E1|nr:MULTISPECIES: sulfurtransferase complex subunit TusD [unclassified Neptuniibacter]MAY43535.1 sulfurtransferase complex subunit TusD [Oceanospirillaceae bacterium]|tara:strand:+ start:2771 stop:3163 length:393 start_codon:yes stop_codon:yes gene_type:complete